MLLEIIERCNNTPYSSFDDITNQATSDPKERIPAIFLNYSRGTAKWNDNTSQTWWQTTDDTSLSKKGAESRRSGAVH
jgi:hypothetical protein